MTARQEPPASEESPLYRKVKQSRGLFLIVCDEGWRASVLCSGMYENDADFVLRLLGRESRAGRRT